LFFSKKNFWQTWQKTNVFVKFFGKNEFSWSKNNKTSSVSGVAIGGASDQHAFCSHLKMRF